MNKITFPLPISSNFTLFNYTFKDGPFTECRILWPASFLKENEKMGEEHVFILKNLKNHFFHVFWRWTSKTPELLTEDHWNGCFLKKKHTSFTNRYLFMAHGQSLLLPYVPHMLHVKWSKTNITERDDAFIASVFQKYFDTKVFDIKKKRFERFPGWQRKVLKNSINEYVKYFIEHNSGVVPINITKPIKDLSKDELLLLEQTCSLFHAIFPSFSVEC